MIRAAGPEIASGRPKSKLTDVNLPRPAGDKGGSGPPPRGPHPDESTSMTAEQTLPQRPLPAPLAEAVEAAYRTFAPYRIGRRIAVCHCPVCMTDETELKLTATPLRQISADLMAEYTNSAHETHAGRPEADEFRYFLPRYFELIAQGETPDHLGEAVPLRRLGRSSFRNVWPEREIGCIDRFFDAYMAARIADTSLYRWPSRNHRGYEYELQVDIRDTLTLLVTAGARLTRILDIWDAAPDPAAAAHMAEARQRVTWKKGRSLFHHAHLEGAHDAEAEAIAAFLNRPETGRRIEEAFLATADEGLEYVLQKGLIYE